MEPRPPPPSWQALSGFDLPPQAPIPPDPAPDGPAPAGPAPADPAPADPAPLRPTPTPTLPPRPRPPTRARRSLRGPLVLLGVLLLGWAALHVGRGYRHALAADAALLDRALAARDAAFAAVPLLRADERAALRAPAYRAHVAFGERLGVAPTATQAALRSGGEAPGLVVLATTEVYHIAPARYSVPRATPDAAAVLDSIGAAFGERLARRGLPPFAFVVTSVLRSGEDQEELRRVNPNAAAGRSSHEYGVSFDITYRRYLPAPDTTLARPSDRVPHVLRAWARARRLDRIGAHTEHLGQAYPARLDALLGRSLLALKADSMLVVLRERRQPVYHVTVARRLGPPAGAP